MTPGQYARSRPDSIIQDVPGSAGLYFPTRAYQARRPLELTEAQMRRFGYSVVDLLVRHFTSLPKKSVGQRASSAELKARLDEGLPSGSDELM